MMEKQKQLPKLGIDAKWFFDGPPSGNMVVKNLVNNLLIENVNFKIYLFFSKKHKKLAEDFFSEDVILVFLPSVPNFLSNILLVPFAVQKHGIDIMLFQNFISFWPSKLFKVAYIHDMLFLDYPQYYTATENAYFKYMKLSASASDMVITISNAEKQRLIAHDLAHDQKVAVVYHGINENFRPRKFCSCSKINNPADQLNLPERYLLYVGRVNVRKNLSTLLKALAVIDDRDIKLLVVGEGSNLTKELCRITDRIDLNGRVIFTGHVSERDLYRIYANATIFCFPSYAEGFGLPPLEAMQCGVPVIVSDRTAMPEICGDAAVYINPDDAGDIAQKINLLLNNCLFRMQKAAAGIAHSQSFTWKKAAVSVLELIENAYDRLENYK